VEISIASSVNESVKPPRIYYLKYPFGHAMGEALNWPQQKQIFFDCLKFLETVNEPEKIFESPYRWKIHKFE